MTLFGLLMIKHFIIDLGVQQYLGQSGKHRYFSKLAHYHYLHHGLGTFVVCWLLLPVDIALLIGIVDWFVHWHIDFCKHHLNRAIGAVPRTMRWWWTNVLDQCLHTATYWIITMTVIQWPVGIHLIPQIYV